MTCVVTTVAVLSPVTGYLLDRFPIRVLFFAGSALQALALLALARIKHHGARRGRTPARDPGAPVSEFFLVRAAPA
jgi:hypothetical protein